jgi:UDP-N-acetylmuramoyl-L-alanyl-D-glutamate--2,6-diaminopimelate ligase
VNGRASIPHDIAAWLREQAPSGQLSGDSRAIAQGDVFFAYPGDHADGRNYVARAIEQGAAAVLYEQGGAWGGWDPQWNVPHRAVDGLQAASGAIASAYYDRPDSAMYTVAVTGTNGKTSCALWLGKILSRQGEPAAVIGTLGVGVMRDGDDGEFDDTGFTTPDAVLLQRSLARVRDAGAQALAIEASSIGIVQKRMDGMHVDCAVFTNLTRDHLDYHGTMEAYSAAKAALFDWPGLRHAVLNLDDPFGLELAGRLAARGGVQVFGYALNDVAAPAGVDVLRALDVRGRNAGTEFNLDAPSGQAHVKTRLVGRFNVSNVLAVLGVLLAKGMPLRAAVASVEALSPAPGRMQQLGGVDAPMIVIDYAHTPDALEKTLAALRVVATERGGQLWCVFGCGGDRDPGKRPQMGAIAEQADHVIVTSDNPRTENPAHIIAQIRAGMTGQVQAIEDRAAAILSAVRHAAKADVVLLAGKGHETYQEINGKRLPFSDADHTSLALAARATMMRTP